MVFIYSVFVFVKPLILSVFVHSEWCHSETCFLCFLWETLEDSEWPNRTWADICLSLNPAFAANALSWLLQRFMGSFLSSVWGLTQTHPIVNVCDVEMPFSSSTLPPQRKSHMDLQRPKKAHKRCGTYASFKVFHFMKMESLSLCAWLTWDMKDSQTSSSASYISQVHVNTRCRSYRWASNAAPHKGKWRRKMWKEDWKVNGVCDWQPLIVGIRLNWIKQSHSPHRCSYGISACLLLLRLQESPNINSLCKSLTVSH